jgi:hypothetical protein
MASATRYNSQVFNRHHSIDGDSAGRLCAGVDKHNRGPGLEGRFSGGRGLTRECREHPQVGDC